MPRAILSLLLALFLSLPAYGGGIAVYDGANHATALKDLLETIALVKDSLEQAATIASGTDWGDAGEVLGAIRGLAERSHSLIERGRALEAIKPSAELQAALISLREAVTLALEATSRAQKVHTLDLALTNTQLASLKSRNDGARGRMQALQIGNQITSVQAAELTKIRSLLRDLIAAESLSTAQHLSEQTIRDRAEAAFFDASASPSPGTTTPFTIDDF